MRFVTVTNNRINAIPIFPTLLGFFDGDFLYDPSSI